MDPATAAALGQAGAELTTAGMGLVQTIIQGKQASMATTEGALKEYGNQLAKAKKKLANSPTGSAAFSSALSQVESLQAIVNSLTRQLVGGPQVSPVPAPGAGLAYAPKAKAKKSNTTLYIVGGVVLAAVVVGGAFYMSQGR